MKWSRLFGGAAILLGVDDGGDWDEPINRDNVMNITSLVVLERPEITPDYTSVFMRDLEYDSMEHFGLPEYYNISPVYGGSQVRVHESRLLIFRNGIMPRTGSASNCLLYTSTLSDGEQFTPDEQAELRWKFIEDLMGNAKDIVGKSERTIKDAERKREEDLYCAFRIEKAVEMYREECEKSGSKDAKRRYRELKMM